MDEFLDVSNTEHGPLGATLRGASLDYGKFIPNTICSEFCFVGIHTHCNLWRLHRIPVSLSGQML
eukprot:11419109-Ditylum_brightwellii.AAC.1